MATVKIHSALQVDGDDPFPSVDVEAWVVNADGDCPNGICIVIHTKKHVYELVISHNDMVEAILQTAVDEMNR